ncbi:hypothetical protein B0H66DRAFT_331726 [Apodospora peruviana]|uniref:Uncharacterized protein n=1 Tax=Apodospora peruviana TaxID=516989 RepID=A0AAE0HY58_9PEZI|nr:hypothetical protein B0H66DRAFT_331726 [Apodospora peruviana]
MAWDSKSTRRRQNSTTSGASAGSRSLPIHTRQQSRHVAQAKSAHAADPFLQDFLSPSFDAAAYLNSTLPPLQTSAALSSGTQTKPAVPLAELSLQAQSVLSQLNAHTTRLTATMTQLTDDILRSGGRLAYEVELLRGETLSLAEALTEGLHDDIVKFVPDGLQDRNADLRIPTTPAAPDTPGFSSSHQRRLSVAATAPPPAPPPGDAEPAAGAAEAVAPTDPSYIAQLRTMTLVRGRLDSVIKMFGDAMEFVFPPSEISVSSSFLSVSAPDAGGENHSTEEKGQQVLQALRDEISEILNKSADPIKGIEDAARRIEELKELSKVWKGTAEEKGRAKFIESLARMVEDKHSDLMRDIEQSSSSRRDTAGKHEADSHSRKASGAENDVNQSSENRGGYGGYGLISQLQKLRNGL